MLTSSLWAFARANTSVSNFFRHELVRRIRDCEADREFGFELIAVEEKAIQSFDGVSTREFFDR